MNRRFFARVRGFLGGRRAAFLTLSSMILHASFAAAQAAPSPRTMAIFHSPTSLKLPSEKEQLSHVVPCADGLGLVYGKTSLSFFPNNGLRLSWKKKLTGPVDEVKCIGGQLVALGQDVTSFDAESGEMRWNYPLTGMKLLGVYGSSAVIAGFEPVYGQVMLISLQNGEHRWRSWQVVSGAKIARVENEDVLVLVEKNGKEKRMKFDTGRILSSVEKRSLRSGGMGLDGYPVVEPKKEIKSEPRWTTLGRFNDESWLKSGGYLLLLKGETPPEIIGEHRGRLFARIGTQVFSVVSTPLSDWAFECRTALGLPGEKGEQCGRFLNLHEPDLESVQNGLRDVISRKLRTSCEQGDSSCGLWTRWTESVLAFGTHAMGESEGNRARELGLLAIQLGIQGEFENARRLVKAIAAVPGPRWDILVFGLASMEARQVLEAGKAALRQGRSGEALEAVQRLENFEAMQSLLPESIVDAGDGSQLLKQAIRDLDEVIPELAPNGQSQGVCLFRCRLMAELDGGHGTDQGCTSGCVL